MKCNWTTKKLSEIAYINPRESLGKGVVAKKVPMDKLQPFCRDIPEFVLEEYKGGTKFRNGDTIMARITPCLENGKIAKVSVLSDGEVGFGSTEYIVFRAIDGVSDADFLYYLICSPLVRNPAIKSMVGSSGRQRVQTDVVANLDVELPPIEEQRKIGGLLKAIDDKIELNDVINNNLLQQLHILYSRLFCDSAMDTPLGEVVATTSGGTPSRKHDEYYSDSSICWVKSKELLGNYIHETEEHINDLAIKKSSAKLLPKHSVLIAMFATQSETIEAVYLSIHTEALWNNWINSSGKSDPPPDYYSPKDELMMDVMRVDDHAFVDKKGKIQNPTNAGESKLYKELKESGIQEIFPNTELIVNAKTLLPSEQDHNYLFYKSNFERVVSEHIKKLPLYQSNHIGYKTVLFVMDESSAYLQCENNKPNMDEAHEGEMIAGKPHLFFWDKNFVNVFLHSGIDYLIWYAPYKLLRTSQGIFELPKVVMFDCKTGNYDNLIKYNEERICSSEL